MIPEEVTPPEGSRMQHAGDAFEGPNGELGCSFKDIYPNMGRC